MQWAVFSTQSVCLNRATLSSSLFVHLDISAHCQRGGSGWKVAGASRCLSADVSSDGRLGNGCREAAGGQRPHLAVKRGRYSWCHGPEAASSRCALLLRRQRSQRYTTNRNTATQHSDCPDTRQPGQTPTNILDA